MGTQSGDTAIAKRKWGAACAKVAATPENWAGSWPKDRLLRRAIEDGWPSTFVL